jgi:hypothetical protein
MREFTKLYEKMKRDDPSGVARSKRWVAERFYQPEDDWYKTLMREADELDRAAHLNSADQ